MMDQVKLSLQPNVRWVGLVEDFRNDLVGFRYLCLLFIRAISVGITASWMLSLAKAVPKAEWTPLKSYELLRSSLDSNYYCAYIWDLRPTELSIINQFIHAAHIITTDHMWSRTRHILQIHKALAVGHQSSFLLLRMLCLKPLNLLEAFVRQNW